MNKLQTSPVRLRAASMLLAASMGLSACAGQVAYDSNLSPAQNQLRQSNARFNQTVGEGAVTGAVIGGLAGLALGGRNRAGAAAMGAAAGGALGAGAGYLVARNNLSRSSTEAQFNDAIAQAQDEASKFQSSAQASRQVADQAYAEAQRLRGQVRSGQITQAQYRAGVAKYQVDRDAIQTQISEARKASSAMRQDAGLASGSNRGGFSNAAVSVDRSTREMERDEARMSQVLAGSV